MRRIFTLSIAACLMITAAVAQSPGLYFNINGGYSWPGFQKTNQPVTFMPASGSTDPANSAIISMVNQNLTDTNGGKYTGYAYDGYGRGGNLNFAVGYMINPYVGFELGMAYHFGATLRSSSISNEPGLGTNVTMKTATNSYGLSLMPAIRFRAAKPEAKFYPFARLGLTLPVWGATLHTLNIDAPEFINLGSGNYIGAASEIKVKTQSTVSLGVNGSVGVGYDPLSWLGIYAQVDANLLYVRPEKSTLEKYSLKTINGSNVTEADVLATLTPFSIETEYKDKIVESDNTLLLGKTRGGTNPVDETKARVEKRQSANFSTIGFSVGLRFFLSKDFLSKKKK